MTRDEGAAALRSLTRGVPAMPLPPYPWRTRVALPAGLLLGLLAMTGWAARDAFLPSTDVRVVPVVLRPAPGEPSPGARSPLPTGGAVVTQAAGWVEPDPYPIAVSALTDGVVREVLVLEGQPVRKGDVLARLIDDDAILAVARADAELASRRANLEAARRQWERPVEGDRAVAATAAAVDEAKAELDRLEADVAAEEARADELADQLRRIEPSAATGAASLQELEAIRFRLVAQRAVARASAARRPVLEAQLRQRQTESHAAAQNRELRIDERRTLDSAEAAFRLAAAQLDEAKLRLARTEVRAPADGVVMNRLVEPGGKLMMAMDSPTSSYVARLYDPARLQVRVDVPLADASKVGVGTPAEITVEALPGRTLAGEVSRVVHEADVAKNTVQVKVRISAPADGLRPEMLARVRFLAAAPGAATTRAAGETGGEHLPFILESMVRREPGGDGGGGASVMVVDRGRGVAVRRPVVLGQTRLDGWAAVTAGLAAGDDVIADPSDVPAGRRVRVVGEAAGEGRP